MKPGLFKNEVLGTADPLYTVVFEGLWCLADREGRLEDRPLRIHAEINPYRNSASTVQALDWLVLNRFVIRYEHAEASYLSITNFREHQQPHVKEAPSKLPAPPNQGVVQAPYKNGASTVKARLIPSSLTADSGLPLPEREHAREAAKILNSMLDDWRRDVPECNAEAFTKWIVQLELQGKQMNPGMRLAQAKRLAGYGNFQQQEEIVAYCLEQGWKTLIPYADVLARTRGMSRGSTSSATAKYVPSAEDFQP